MRNLIRTPHRIRSRTLNVDSAIFNLIEAAHAKLRKINDEDIEILGIVYEWDDTPYRISGGDAQLRRVTGIVGRVGCESDVIYDGVAIDSCSENTS